MPQFSLFEAPTSHGSSAQLVEGTNSFVPLSALMSPSSSRLTGIARLAAEAAIVDSRRDVEYRDLPCRTLISRCDSPRVPFEFQINPYRGCVIGCAYCLAPETPILYADMIWRPIGEAKPGDLLAGFDESPLPGEQRKLRASVVQAVWWSRRQTSRLITEHEEIAATPEHRWLQGPGHRWSKTERLRAGWSLRRIGHVRSVMPDDDYRVGYIAGLSLGDGTMRFNPDWRSDKLSRSAG